MNDFVRSRAMDPETGRIKLGWELVAGGTAGGCQVVCVLTRCLMLRCVLIVLAVHRSSQTRWKLCKPPAMALRVRRD